MGGLIVLDSRTSTSNAFNTTAPINGSPWSNVAQQERLVSGSPIVDSSAVRDQLGSSPGENEQMVVNRLLFHEECGIRNVEFGMEKPENEKRNAQIFWDYLPGRFYARTQGRPPPLRLAIYHANYTPKGPMRSDRNSLSFERSRRFLGAACWRGPGP